MNNILQYLVGIYIVASSAVLYKQAVRTSDEEVLKKIVSEQLEGKLSANAKLITQADERLKKVQSQMVTHEELQTRSKELTRDLSSQTQTALEEFRRTTKAEIDQITKVYRRINIKLDKGKAQVGSQAESKTPVPKDWKGVSEEEQAWCKKDPGKCAPFPFSWKSSHLVNGKTIALFSTDNLWKGDLGDYDLDLNLAFNITAITHRANTDRPEDGLVRNQGIHVMAGYLDEKGDFVMLAEDKILSDDPRFQGLTLTSPTEVYTPDKLDTFELSFLSGLGYVFQDGLAASAGASIVNLADGEYRLGAHGLFSIGKGVGAGLFVTWHPSLFGKQLNLAPFVGYNYMIKDGYHAPSLGLYFKMW